MAKPPSRAAQRLAENQELRARLAEAEQTLDAIRSGEVDALVVSGEDGERIFTLKGADQSYQMLIEAMQQGALIASSEGLILYANQSFAGMLKAPLEQVIGSALSEWIAPQSQTTLNTLLRQHAGARQASELLLAGRDGTRVPVLVSVTQPLLNGESEQLCLVATDLSEVNERKKREAQALTQQLASAERFITEIKLVEAALRESETRFHLLADTAPVLIWMSTPDKLCNWFNQVWLTFTGRSMAQEMGNGWAEGVHPDDLQRCLAIYVGAFDARQEFSMEYRLRRFDGAYRWLLDKGIPRHDAQGGFLGYIGSCIDITDRKNAEDESRRLLAIIEDAQDFIATADMQTHLKYLNRAGARLVGLPENVDLSTLDIQDMHPTWGARLVLEEGIPAVLKHGYWQHENALLRRDGHEIPVSQILLLHRDQADQPLLLSTIMRDISDSKAAELKLKRSEEQLRLSQAQMEVSQLISGTGSWVYDIASSSVRASPNALVLFGLPAIDRDYAQDEFLAGVEKAEHVRQGLASAILEGREYSDEFVVHPADGSPARIIHAVGTIERNTQGNPVRILGFNQDITQRRQLEKEVQQLAFHDSLTGLPNRRLLTDRLIQAMATSKRSGRHGALLFLDLDNFKPLNDAHGHEVGDLLLVEVASRLKACVREIDVVARFGGDEFVVLLSDLDIDQADSKTQANQIAEKIRLKLAELYVLNIGHAGQGDRRVEHRCSASIGGVVFLNHEATIENLLKWADQAMYQAKDCGRNTVRFC